MSEFFAGQISWRLVVIAALILIAMFMMYRFNKAHGNKYDVIDLITTEDGRADLWKHLIVFFAGISAWVIIQKVVTNPKDDITGLLTIVLGVFVSKEILGAFADAMKSRPPAPPAPELRITATAPAPVEPVVDAGRGTEPMPSTIGQEDVGKKPLLSKSTKKGSKK